MLILRKPLCQQPAYPIGIDWENPLSRALIFLETPTTCIDPTSGRLFTDVSLSAGAGQAGKSFVYNGTSSRRQLSGVGSNATDGYSCVALLRSTSASGTQTVLQTDLVSGQIQFLLCIGGQPVFNGMANYNTGWATSGITTDIRGDNKTHLIVGTISGAAARYYIDGRLDASGAVGTITGTKTSLITSGLRPEDSAGFVGDIFLSAVFNRALLPSEVADLAANPWQLLEPRRIIVPVAAAGGGVTIDGAIGNAVAAGVAGTTTQDSSIAATVGNAVAAGAAGSTTQAITIAASVGNAVAAGITGAATQAVEIAGVVGNAVAAGVTGLAEVSGSISIDGVAGNAVAAGVAGSPGVAITIDGSVGNAAAAGVSGLAAIGILIDGSVGNATAAGTTGTLSLDIVVPGVVGNAVAAGTAGSASVSGSGTGATAEEIVALLMATEVEAGVSVQTALRVLLAAVSGPTSGLGTSTERYFDPSGLIARITANFDSNSNRTSVTLDGS